MKEIYEYEHGLPEYLQHDLDMYKEGLRTNSNLLDCYWGELYGSINGAEIDDGAITPDHANYNDSAQKTPAVRKNVRGMNAPITNNATIIPTGFSSGIVGFSWLDVLQNAVIRCIALLFQEKHFR